MNDILLQIVPQVVLVMLVTLITAFFALHAAQHVANPTDRAVWLLIIVPFTIFGSAFYALTKYRAFRRIGRGSLIRTTVPRSFVEFISLSERDRNS